MSAGVLSMAEMEAGVAALLSGEARLLIGGLCQPRAGSGAVRGAGGRSAGRRSWRRLEHFCRAYAFLARFSRGLTSNLERLFLYGRLLLIRTAARREQSDAADQQVGADDTPADCRDVGRGDHAERD